MPRFTESVSLEDHQVGAFGFTAVNLDDLNASQFTLATLVCDRSGSTKGFQNEMEAALKSAVTALKKHPSSDTILLRVVRFDSNEEELHGFIPVDSIDTDDYDGALQPGGMTALFGSCVSAVEATEAFSGKLSGRNFRNNGIVIVITDSLNNSGKYPRPEDVVKVRESFESVMQQETLDSMTTILIGVNVNHPQVKDGLVKFHGDAAFSQPFIPVDDASPDTIARIGRFMTTSISSTSMALGSGQPSQTLNF